MSKKNTKLKWGGAIAVVLAIIASVTGAAININIENGKVKADIVYSGDPKPAEVTGGLEKIEYGLGEAKADGETIPTVESVDSTGPQVKPEEEDSTECPEGEECGRGATYPYIDTSTPQAFLNATIGGCYNVDGYYDEQSLVPGTQILKADGTYTAVENLKAGDEILAADGRTVNHVANNTTTDELIYEVETNNGYIRGTAGHRVFIGGVAVKLEDLKEGMVIDVPDYDGVDLGLTEDEYKFLGMWLGDGSYHVVREKYPEVFITVGTDEKRDYIRSLDLDITERTHSNGRASVFYLRTTEKKLYEIIGKYSDKSIPVLSAGVEQVIEGFIQADGSETHENSYAITNTNKALLASIQEMAWNVGYTARLSLPIEREATNLTDNPKTLYRLSVNTRPQRNFVRGKVLKVKNTGQKLPVYHLNVWEDNHSYIAEGLAHHNCWDYAALFFLNYAGHTFYTCGSGAAKGAIVDGCWQQNATDKFTMVWDAQQLQAGDIVVFNNGQFGHVGMATGAYNNGYITLAGQNQGGGLCPGSTMGSRVNIINISLKYFAGAFRPNSYIKPEPQPDPEPTPAPTPAPEPISVCKRWTLSWGDTLGKIMQVCEGKVEWGKAMEDYAKTWIDEATGIDVFTGWTTAPGIGLYAGHVIERK